MEQTAKEGRRLPDHVCSERKNGQAVYYFRRGHGLRIRLPTFGTPEFMPAYSRALEANPDELKPRRPTVETIRKQAVERSLRSSISTAQARATASGRDFDLTLDWALKQVEAQGFKCALSGIAFYSGHASEGTKNPYSPSLDRIKAGGGYTQDNVRIVIFALNVMLMDWGTDIFEHVAACYTYRKRQIRNDLRPHRRGKRPHLNSSPIKSEVYA